MKLTAIEYFPTALLPIIAIPALNRLGYAISKAGASYSLGFTVLMV
jgi:hypothetical protein